MAYLEPYNEVLIYCKMAYLIPKITVTALTLLCLLLKRHVFELQTRIVDGESFNKSHYEALPDCALM